MIVYWIPRGFSRILQASTKIKSLQIRLQCTLLLIKASAIGALLELQFQSSSKEASTIGKHVILAFYFATFCFMLS